MLDDRLSQYQAPVAASPSFENKVFAALSYVAFLFVVPWVVRGQDPFIKSHIRQGVVLFCVELIGWVIFNLILSIDILWLVLYILFVAISIWGIVNALRGLKWEVPLVGKYGAEIKV
jgi:uncharacterized membrane protein